MNRFFRLGLRFFRSEEFPHENDVTKNVRNKPQEFIFRFMRYGRSMHSYGDSELVTGSVLAKQLGVSDMAVSKAKMSNRIDTFDDSKGRERYHPIVSAQQFRASRDRRHVTTATKGQRAAGLDDLAAQAVAYSPEFDQPRGEFGEPLPRKAPPESFDFGQAMMERKELEVSKAEKEYQLARLAKMKADAMEGRLVDKAVAFNKVYAIAAEAQEKIVSNYIVLAPKIAGTVQQLLVESGFDEKPVRLALKSLEHTVGELIRKENLNSLRTFSEGMEKQEILE